MNLTAHLDALNSKHAELEAALEAERMRPMPDFGMVTELKKRKLLLKEEISSLSEGERRYNKRYSSG